MSQASPLPFTSTGLPVEPVLPELLTALALRGMAVLSAEPGAGKTTLVPPALLGAPWLKGQRIVMLQPRRVAAQTSARRIADLLGEKVGQTVGYRIALESRVSAATRIEIITEGILTRMIQDDPELPGVGALIFDEFHERSLHADLGLAFALEIRESLRPNLRILVMSATIDTAALAALMAGMGHAGNDKSTHVAAGNPAPGRSSAEAAANSSPAPPPSSVPIIRSEGRTYPVETAHAPPPLGSDFWKSPRQFAAFAAKTIAAINKPGDVLVFMPGRREIRDLEERLREAMAAELRAGLEIAVLSGDMDAASQAALIRDKTAKRRIVISTSLAETSVTIQGIGVVVDSGLARFNRLDPQTGMDRLVTERVSLASSLQRQGRAGRLGPGFCIKLWAAEERLPAFLPPEIERGDLSSFALEAAAWGKGFLEELRLLSPPGPGPLAQARRLLQELGALESGQRLSITTHGRAMAKIGMHPRAAHVLAKASGPAALACAVFVEDPNLLWGSGIVDPGALLQELSNGKNPDFERARQRLRVMAQRMRAGASMGSASNLNSAEGPENAAGPATGDGRLPGYFAMAFPDRLARLKERGREFSLYSLTNGRLARIPAQQGSPEWLVVLDADAGTETARIHAAIALSGGDIASLTAELSTHDEIEWDGLRPKSFVRRAVGKIVFEERVQALSAVNPEIVFESFLEVLNTTGLSLLPWNDESSGFYRRVRYVAACDKTGTFTLPAELLPWPAADDATTIKSTREWLFPNLNLKGGPILDQTSFASAVQQILNWKQRQWLESELPTKLKTPAGSSRPLEYPVIPEEAMKRLNGQASENDMLPLPIMPVPAFFARIQEIFGMTRQPRILRRPVQLHLLSPAGRPLQITEDLESFWKNTYPEVRKEMRGRYPKHYWPENPLDAEPTTRAKPRGT